MTLLRHSFLALVLSAPIALLAQSTLTWDTSRLSSEGILGVSAVPEPGTYTTLAGLAMLGFAIWRKRRATPIAK